MSEEKIKIHLNSGQKITIEKSENFKGSIFEDVYKAALDSLVDILDNSGSENHPYESYNNVISFTGERGQGKTSAMISFLEGLKSVGRSVESDTFFNRLYDQRGNPERHFIILDIIDPSLFKGNESLLEIVVAQMFSMFKRALEKESKIGTSAISDDNRRTLVQKFQTVFENLKYTNGNLKGELYQRDALDALIKLSTSSNLKDSFKNLVKCFLDVMTSDRKIKSVLIIPIDDFDLKIEGVYEMLEDLRQFLITENIVVMVACKMEQMREAVQVSIYSKYAPLMSSVKNTSQIFDHKDVVQKSSKYLEKLFPYKTTIQLKNVTNLKLEEKISGVAEEFNSDVNHAVLGMLYQKNNVFVKQEELSSFVLLDTTLRSLSSLNAVIGKSLADLKYYITNDIRNQDFIPQQIEKLKSLLESKSNLLRSNFVNLIAPEFKRKNLGQKNYLLYPKRFYHVSFSDCNTIFQLLEEDFNLYDINFEYVEYLKFIYSCRNDEFSTENRYPSSYFENYTLINLEDLPVSNRFRKSDQFQVQRDTFLTNLNDAALKEVNGGRDRVLISSLVSHLGDKNIRYRNETDSVYARKKPLSGSNYKSFRFSVFELFVAIYKPNMNIYRLFNNASEETLRKIEDKQTEFNQSKYFSLFLNPFFVSEFYNAFVLECNSLKSHKELGMPKLTETGEEDYHSVLIDYFEHSLSKSFERLNKKYPYLDLDYQKYIQLNFVIDRLINSKENETIKTFINSSIREAILQRDDERDIIELTTSAADIEIREFIHYLTNTRRIYETTIKKLINKIRFKDKEVAKYLSSLTIDYIKLHKDDITSTLENVLSNIAGNGLFEE